jgi:HD-like signal output (HDOD) protein
MDIVKTLIQGVDEFPTLPTIYSALSDVMSNPSSSHADAANVIASDQASAAKILKAANSPIFGFLEKIDTVSQSIFFIGFNEVKNLILALAVLDIFKKTKVFVEFNPVDLWKHSIAVGVISRILGKAYGIKNVENFFISGIIHDIGKLLFIRVLEDKYTEVVLFAKEEKISIRDAETAKLGITHNVAGELIADKWKLPLSIKNAIRFHYNGTVNNEFELLTSCVHLANITARLLNLGDAGDNLIQEPNFSLWECMNLPNNTFTSLNNKILNYYQSSMEIFSL